MQWTISFVTLIAGVVTIVWFIRDVRKENSKILKSILDVQKAIEEGQRKGFEKLETGLERLGEMLLKQTEILARINSKLK
jgi:hypothetical protein